MKGRIAAFALLAVPCLAVADDGYPLRYVDVIHETFFISTPAARGLAHRLDWTEIRGRVNDNWLVQVTHLQMPNQNFIDETFVQYQQPSFFLRAGKLRSGFGFGTWSDLFYNVVSRTPIVRAMPMLDAYSLQGFGGGVEFEGYSQGLEYSLAVTDGTMGNRQILPDRMNVVQGRLQVPVGEALVGLNVANVSAGQLGQGGQVYGLDFWLNHGRWSLKGEVLGSAGKGQTAAGYYTDLSYRVTHPFRPHIGVRFEEYRMGADHDALVTPGIRISPTKELAFGLNYGIPSNVKLFRTGSGAPVGGGGYGGGSNYPHTLEGWSFQAMLTFRFRA